MTPTKSTYTACTRCILTKSDYPDMQFDQHGVCDVCRINDEWSKKYIIKGDAGKKKLNHLLLEIKSSGKNNEYDCLLGISGGIDSTYLAWLCKEWGLRPLVVHVDNGWNSVMASKNIDKTVRQLNYGLYTDVLNWEEMKDLQLAFFKSDVIDIDLPFDNAFMAVLNSTAKKFRIKHILSGHNVATEGYLPPNFTHYKLDKKNILDIHKKFGSIRIKSFPLMGFKKQWIYENIFGIRMYNPLDWTDYNKVEAKKLIEEELSWTDYGEKHYENIFTRFYQGYILPRKFGVEKRKAHLSVLICSGQITREEALDQIQQPAYEEKLLEQDRLFFIKKLGLTEAEFETIMKRKEVPHTHYKYELSFLEKLRPMGRLLRK